MTEGQQNGSYKYLLETIDENFEIISITFSVVAIYSPPVRDISLLSLIAETEYDSLLPCLSCLAIYQNFLQSL